MQDIYNKSTPKWNHHSLTLKDKTVLNIRDTIHEDTHGILFCFEDPSLSHNKNIEELAKSISSFNIGVLVFDWPENYLCHFPKESTMDAFNDETTMTKGHDILTQIFDAFSSRYQTFSTRHLTYKPAFFCYANGYLAHLILSSLPAQSKFFAFLYYLEMPVHISDRPEEYPTLLGNYISRFELTKTSRCYEDYRLSFVRFLEPDWTTELLHILLKANYKYERAFLWHKLLDILDKEIDSEEKTYTDADIADLLIFLSIEGCPEAAVKLSDLASKNFLFYAYSTEKAKKHFPGALRLFPEELFWTVVAADLGHLPSRTLLFNEHMPADLKDSLIPILDSDILAGRSFTAILAGLCAEKGWLNYRGTHPVISGATETTSIPSHPEAVLTEITGQLFVNKEIPSPENPYPYIPDFDLAFFFYRQAAALGDPEAWYRMGRILEYIKNRSEEAIPFYKEAAGRGFIPAMILTGHHLEQTARTLEDYTELQMIYSDLACDIKAPLFLIRSGTYHEKLGELEDAANDYMTASEYYWDDTTYSDLDREYSYHILDNDYKYPVLFIQETDRDCNDALSHLIALLISNLSVMNPRIVSNAISYIDSGDLSDLSEISEYINHLDMKDPDFSLFNTPVDPVPAALYLIGLYYLKNIYYSQNGWRAMLYFRAAAYFHMPKAKIYTDFLEEAEHFLEEAIRSSGDGPASDELMRKEAAFRLRFLSMQGLPDMITDCFTQDQIVHLMFDEDFSVEAIVPDDPDERIAEILKGINTIESVHHGIVYFVLIDSGWPGTYNLFYVSPDIDEWKWDRKQLAEGEPFVYVSAFSGGSARTGNIPEIGPIGITVTENGICKNW